MEEGRFQVTLIGKYLLLQMRYWDIRDDDLALLTLVNRALRLRIQERRWLLAQGGEFLIGTNLDGKVRFITSIKTSLNMDQE